MNYVLEEDTSDKSPYKITALITLEKTDSSNPDFLMLVDMLDHELQVRDGADHPFYAQFNTLSNIRHVIVAYAGDHAVGCGAFRSYNAQSVEIKRMFVRPEHRGKGAATLILTALEWWAKESGFQESILETGFNQPEAIALYAKTGYGVIPNYGPYENVATSVCLRKTLVNLTDRIL